MEQTPERIQRMSEDTRLSLLDEIHKRFHILNPRKTDSAVTNGMKSESWKEVWAYCVENKLPMVKKGRDYLYIKAAWNSILRDSRVRISKRSLDSLSRTDAKVLAILQSVNLADRHGVLSNEPRRQYIDDVPSIARAAVTQHRPISVGQEYGSFPPVESDPSPYYGVQSADAYREQEQQIVDCSVSQFERPARRALSAAANTNHLEYRANDGGAKMTEIQKLGFLDEIHKRFHVLNTKNTSQNSDVSNKMKARMWSEVWEFCVQNQLPLVREDRTADFARMTWSTLLRDAKRRIASKSVDDLSRTDSKILAILQGGNLANDGVIADDLFPPTRCRTPHVTKTQYRRSFSEREMQTMKTFANLKREMPLAIGETVDGLESSADTDEIEEPMEEPPAKRASYLTPLAVEWPRIGTDSAADSYDEEMFDNNANILDARQSAKCAIQTIDDRRMTEERHTLHVEICELDIVERKLRIEKLRRQLSNA